MTSQISFLESLQTFEFMRNAFLAGIIVGVTCSILSVYVVVKRLAFIGQGISHSAFGGVALALFLFQDSVGADLKVNIVTLIFCLLVAALIGWASRGRRISEDSAIGIFFAVSMAAGVIFIAMRHRYTGEVFSYLFGDILGVSSVDIASITILAVLVLGVIIAFFKEIFFFCFDERLATISGLPTRFLHYLLLILLAFTIVISIKVVGIILVSAFLVIPGATAKLLSASFKKMLVIATALGTTSSLIGLYASYHLDIPSGATIVLVQFAMLALAMLYKRLRA
ncbi:MAG: metal ABC transporter permease [Candidatus Coatesbacteria bacterium]|nr:metal ABC transporter permease [Candidatus Coatesbacteria bacterium]